MPVALLWLPAWPAALGVLGEDCDAPGVGDCEAPGCVLGGVLWLPLCGTDCCAAAHASVASRKTVNTNVLFM